MPTAEHHRARVLATIGAVAAHGTLSYLAAVDLLNYTVPTQYRLIDEIAAEDLWMWGHGLIAILLCLSLFWPQRRLGKDGPAFAATACHLAFALLASWAFFNLLWGLSAVRPVSLAGPVLAFVVAAGEHLLATAWTRGTHDKGR